MAHVSYHTVLPATDTRTIPVFTTEHHCSLASTHCVYPQKDDQKLTGG